MREEVKMEVEYERGLNRNYMIFKNMEGFSEDYQIHMLTEQRIENILSVDLRYMNGKPELYYDISAKQKLSEWLKIKKVTYEMLKGIIRSLKNAFEAGADYLLECGCFMLDARYIFIDVESYELSLCYYPLNDTEVTHAGQEFLQYILEMLDYDDKRAVEEAYEIFRLCMRDGFGIELLKKFVEEDKPQTALKKHIEEYDASASDEWVQVVPVKVADEEVWEEREEFGFIPLNLEFRRRCVAALSVMELITLLAVFTLWRENTMALIICGIITLIVVGGILFFTVFYERIMQYTRLVGIRRDISYGDVDDYKEKRGGTGYAEERFVNSQSEAVDMPLEADYEETMLLGYSAHSTGLRRLHYVGEGMQEDIVINNNPFTVGKSLKDADYKLDYPFVSRMHFRIDEKAGEYYITDTNSKNGIMLNREYLNANETAKLEVGDRVEIGSLVFLFQ